MKNNNGSYATYPMFHSSFLQVYKDPKISGLVPLYSSFVRVVCSHVRQSGTSYSNTDFVQS